MMMSRLCFVFALSVFSFFCQAQRSNEHIQVEQSLEDYIKSNHIDEIEDMVHQFASSKAFLTFLLEKGHNIDPENVSISRKDVSVGRDLDVYVKHLTEHQNFTMIMVPLDIYSHVIYDTLLFSVLEVSDQWLTENYPYHDLTDDEEKQKLLSLQNHDMLATHMYEQARDIQNFKVGEVQVKLHESYISSSSIHKHMSDFTKSEKKQLRKSWSLFKKVFAHDVDLNIEMNIYVFGTGDMKILYYSGKRENEFKITPKNIFKRHDFLED